MKTEDIIEELMLSADYWEDEDLQILIRVLESYGKDISLSQLIVASIQHGYNLGWSDAGGL